VEKGNIMAGRFSVNRPQTLKAAPEAPVEVSKGIDGPKKPVAAPERTKQNGPNTCERAADDATLVPDDQPFDPRQWKE
jgi:hypothetical protein